MNARIPFFSLLFAWSALIVIGSTTVQAANSVISWTGSLWPGNEDGTDPDPMVATLVNAGGSGTNFTFTWAVGVPFGAGGGSGPSTAPHDDFQIASPGTWTGILDPGYTPSANVLTWRQDTVELSPQQLTITFSQPLSELKFLLFDLDNNSTSGGTPQNWVDRVTVTANNGSVSPTYTLFTNSSGTPTPTNATNNGAIQYSGNTVTANFNVTQGNQVPGAILNTVLVQFAVLPITSLSIRYDSLGVDAPSSQFVQFSDIRFSAIPEPGTALLLGLAAVGWVSRRRRPSGT
jgi:hypothetical protein